VRSEALDHTAILLNLTPPPAVKAARKFIFVPPLSWREPRRLGRRDTSLARSKCQPVNHYATQSHNTILIIVTTNHIHNTSNELFCICASLRRLRCYYRNVHAWCIRRQYSDFYIIHTINKAKRIQNRTDTLALNAVTTKLKHFNINVHIYAVENGTDRINMFSVL